MNRECAELKHAKDTIEVITNVGKGEGSEENTEVSEHWTRYSVRVLNCHCTVRTERHVTTLGKLS